MTQPVRIGMIGCGAISGAYLSATRRFRGVDIVALADINRAAAEAKGSEFKISQVLSVDALLRSDSIELILNLTVPAAHAQIALAALEAGKHIYSEKPLGISRDEGALILNAANERGLRVGCAPDTFLGAGLQTARKVIDDGMIGRPLSFTAFMMSRGHESWHPNPEFYYQPGGGPMFDMGPYYLTALLNFFGPIRRLNGAAAVAIPKRTIAIGPHSGRSIDVATPDHICGTIEFQNGVVGTIVQSFATWHPTYDDHWPITVYGENGTLRVPDPNKFDGPVMVRLARDPDWSEMHQGFVKGHDRGVGLSDMAQAIFLNQPHRASGELAFAVLDAMAGFLESAQSGRAYEPTAVFHRPPPLDVDLRR